MPPPLKKRPARETGKGGKAKKSHNQAASEPNENSSREVEVENPELEIDTEDQQHDQDEEQRIVDFYEARPYFYDLREEKYRNTKLKEAELAGLAKELSWTGELWKYLVFLVHNWHYIGTFIFMSFFIYIIGYYLCQLQMLHEQFNGFWK